MIRRGKRERPRPEASAPVAPVRPPTANETARTIEQPAVPVEGEPEPSAQVLDELLSFFGVRHGEARIKPSATTTSRREPSAGDPPVTGPPVTELPTIEPSTTEPSTTEPSTTEPSTTEPSTTEPSTTEPPGTDSPVPSAAPPPGVAASPTEFGLVRAPTKRQTRRSAREAKREEKAQRKRLAELAKQRKKDAKKAAKAAKKTGKKAGKKGGPTDVVADPADGTGPDAGEGVRIIAGAAPASSVATESPSPDDGSVGEPGVAVAGPVVDRATVSIGGDDLPDAVYLKGSLDTQDGADGADGSDRSTVFIDDKDPATGAMVSIEVATSAGRIEPRLRDRRIAVKRAVGRKRLKWIAIGTFTVGVVVAALAVMGSGLFAVTDIRVEGAVYSVGPELDAIVDDLDGRNVLRVDTGEIESQLRRIPWVEEARVTTDFPHGATIELRERVPVVAYVGPDQKYRVLDADGRVITVLDGRPTDYLELMVDSAEAPNLAPGALAPEGYRAAATLVTALVDPLRPMVESIAVDAAGTDLTMQLVNGVEVRFGAAEALQDKLVRLTVALIETDPEKAPTTMIDVSTPDIVTS